MVVDGQIVQQKILHYQYTCKKKVVFNFDNGEKAITDYVKVRLVNGLLIITLNWGDSGGWVFGEDEFNKLIKD